MFEVFVVRAEERFDPFVRDRNLAHDGGRWNGITPDDLANYHWDSSMPHAVRLMGWIAPRPLRRHCTWPGNVPHSMMSNPFNASSLIVNPNPGRSSRRSM